MKKMIIVRSLIMLLLFLNTGFFLSSKPLINGQDRVSLMRTNNDSISAVDVFEQIWRLLDANYPFFDQQGIDWKAIYSVYRPKISATTSDDELFSIVSKMLEHFNDGHVNLEAGDKSFCSNIRVNSKMEDFSWKLVRDKYLNKNFKSSPDSLLYYGWLNSDVAYLRIRRFPSKEVLEKYIDKIIDELGRSKGIIIDMRGNPGGNGFGVAALGSRFADRKRLFMKNYNRIGGVNRDFINPTYYYIEPRGPAQYKGPVVLLQNVYSESGSDNFALAMRVLPNATSIGESTGGCFSTYYPEKLINGWTLTMPWSYAVDQNDFCWEGIGVPPDLRKTNTKEDIKDGNDKVLEFGIDILKAGGHYGKEADGSLNDLKISLVDQFIATAASNDIPLAVAQFEESQKKDPAGYYFSLQELQVKVRLLMQDEKNEVAFELLRFGEKAFPEEPSTLYFLARLYDNYKNQPEMAKPLWERLASIKPSFPWERNLVAEAQKNIGKTSSQN